MSTIQRAAILIMAIMPYLQPGYGDISLMSKKSHVEDFEGVTALFEALTSTPNDGYTYDWQVFSIPTKTDDGDKQHGVIRNCTVLYLDQCTSWNKCRRTCHKTGAASYRWFHDGCCECIGGFCSNYGINESRCSHCPEPACDEDED